MTEFVSNTATSSSLAFWQLRRRIGGLVSSRSRLLVSPLVRPLGRKMCCDAGEIWSYIFQLQQFLSSPYCSSTLKIERRDNISNGFCPLCRIKIGLDPGTRMWIEQPITLPAFIDSFLDIFHLIELYKDRFLDVPCPQCCRLQPEIWGHTDLETALTERTY